MELGCNTSLGQQEVLLVNDTVQRSVALGLGVLSRLLTCCPLALKDSID